MTTPSQRYTIIGGKVVRFKLATNVRESCRPKHSSAFTAIAKRHS